MLGIVTLIVSAEVTSHGFQSETFLLSRICWAMSESSAMLSSEFFFSQYCENVPLSEKPSANLRKHRWQASTPSWKGTLDDLSAPQSPQTPWSPGPRDDPRALESPPPSSRHCGNLASMRRARLGSDAAPRMGPPRLAAATRTILVTRLRRACSS